MADLWTVEELVSATGGQIAGQVTRSLNGVSIDTRSLNAGDIFVAIQGDVHDGHKFVAGALEKGAGLALVSHATEEMKAAGPLLVVGEDPLQALVKVGQAARRRSHAQIIAVTGSVGKTSTKEMLRVALSASGLTHASAASYNNHWGVPLTLARLPVEAAYGVFEVGMNHVGEITPLVAQVKPHIAIITTVAPVHIGNFTGIEQIADAKAEILSGIVPGGSAILNRDNPHFERLAAAAKAHGVTNVLSFGKHAEADARLERLVLHPTCCCVTVNVLGEKVIYKLGMPGEHMAMNSLAVLAAVKLAGADLARAALALATAEAPKGRGVQHRMKIGNGSFLLIDESYNANPVSMAAALALLKAAQPGKRGRRIAILGDMLELGDHGPALHSGLSQPVSDSGADIVYAAGPLMQHLWQTIPTEKRGNYAEKSADLVDPLVGALQPGDVVMIKGSLGSRMGLLVEALKTKFEPVSGDT